MMKDFNGWLDYYIAPWIYPGMVLIGVVCYFVVHIIQMKKIKKNTNGTGTKECGIERKQMPPGNEGAKL